jgi:hypothetical protein
MIIEQEGVVGHQVVGHQSVTASKERSKATVGKGTEGTAVFIGKASFRMMPIAQNDASVGPDNRLATPEMTEAAAREAAWFEQGDENVVLPPPITGGSEIWAERVPSDMPRDNGQYFGGRRSMPLWTIGAALLAGVTITLSAQAVMKRPGRFAVSAKMTSGLASQPASVRPSTTPAATLGTPMLAPTLAAPSKTAQTPIKPTVVPTTIVWAVNAPRPSRPLSREPSVDHPRQVHAPRATPPATPTGAKRTATAAWVDPFAADDDRPETSVIEGPRKSAGHGTPQKKVASTPPPARRAGRVGPSTWVDPFAE